MEDHRKCVKPSRKLQDLELDRLRALGRADAEYAIPAWVALRCPLPDVPRCANPDQIHQLNYDKLSALLGQLDAVQKPDYSSIDPTQYLVDLDCVTEQRKIHTRLLRLRRKNIYYDALSQDHQVVLTKLWRASFYGRKLDSIIYNQWEKMGWQDKDTSSELRGVTLLNLESMLFFAENFQNCYQGLLCKRKGGERPEKDYPFAVAGVGITTMLTQMLELEADKPQTRAGKRFRTYLSVDESAFQLLFSIAFAIMDTRWIAMHTPPSVVDLDGVIESARRELETEILLHGEVKQLPSLDLLLED